VVGYLVFYVMALLTKENAVVVPALAFIWLVTFGKISRDRIWALGASGLIMAVYVWSRLVGLSGQEFETLSHIASASVFERIITLPQILSTYLKLLVFPYPLHMEYHFVTTSLLSASFLIGISAVVAVVIVTTKWLGIRKACFGFGWFFAGLMPVLQFPIPLASTLREHWLYLPMIGPLTLLGWAALKIPVKKAWVVPALGISFSIILGGVTIARNFDWQDPFRLYSHDLKYEPKSFLLHNNLGVTHFRNQKFQAAKASFQNAIKATPGYDENFGYGVAHNNLGVILERENDISGAIAHYGKGIRNSDYLLAYQNLGRLWVGMGEYKKARELLLRGTRRYPNDPVLARLLNALPILLKFPEK